MIEAYRCNPEQREATFVGMSAHIRLPTHADASRWERFGLL